MGLVVRLSSAQFKDLYVTLMLHMPSTVRSCIRVIFCYIYVISSLTFPFSLFICVDIDSSLSPSLQAAPFVHTLGHVIGAPRDTCETEETFIMCQPVGAGSGGWSELSKTEISNLLGATSCTAFVPSICTNNSECDDSNACNGAEICNLSTKSCEAGALPDSCDDGKLDWKLSCRGHI